MAREEIECEPGSVDIIPQQRIEESRAANLKGVRPRFGAAHESQLSIRGSGLRNNFHLRGVTILLDGLPYGAAAGFSDFESLELLDVKRVEVYKGANALRYGGGALGGAINLITKTGFDAGRFEIRSFWFAPGVEVVPEGYFVNSENTARAPAHELYSARVGYDYKPWNLSVFFEGRNLANASYVSSVVTDAANGRFFEPGDRRAFYGGVQWRFR
jgi:outer membrane receptor protein involved in Fe transport